MRPALVPLAAAALLASALGAVPARAEASWDEGVELEGVWYLPDYDFLSAAILRYDTQAGAWREPIPLDGSQLSHVAVADAYMYAGFDSGRVVRVGLGGDEPALLAELGARVTSMAAAGDLLFVATSAGLRVLDGRTGALLASRSDLWGGLCLAPNARRVLVRSTRELAAADYSPEGALGEPIRLATVNATWGRCWVAPGEARVVDDAGQVFDVAGLAWRGHLQGRIRQVVFGAARWVAHTGYGLRVYDPDDLAEVGRQSVSATVTRILAQGEELWMRTGGSDVRVPIASIVLPPLEPPAHISASWNARGLALDDEGILYLTVGLNSYSDWKGILRWSSVERRFLDPIPLRDLPTTLAYSRSERRLVLGYAYEDYGDIGGTLRVIDLAEGTEERHLAHLPRGVDLLVDTGDGLVAGDDASRLVSLDASGALRDELATEARAWLSWSPATRSLYYWRGRDGLGAVELDAQGRFGSERVSPATFTHGEDPSGIIRVAPDGRLVVTEPGMLLDGDSLTQLPLVSPTFMDAGWTATGMITVLRFGASSSGPGTPCVLQERDASSGALRASVIVDRDFCWGRFATNGERLVFVWQHYGRLEFVVYPDEDRDGEGIFDGVDAFPDDPAEWADADGDGAGDNRDAFPDDPEESSDFDGDGIGDRSDPFPVGEPFVGLVALEGRQRLNFHRIGALRAPLGGSLGLLADGSFSLCDESSCLFGVHEPLDRDGRKFLLRPDSAWLASVEGSLEEAAAEALSRAFQSPVSLDLVAQPESLRFVVKLDRQRKHAKLRLQVAFEAQMTGTPPRFQRTRVVWTWKFRPARLEPPGS